LLIDPNRGADSPTLIAAVHLAIVLGTVVAPAERRNDSVLLPAYHDA
jgi:predicted N-formylglutamate amidohydrolase